MIRTSDAAEAAWRKSSHSQNGANNCIAVARVDDSTAICDSKNPGGPVLQFTPTAFAAFLRVSRMS